MNSNFTKPINLGNPNEFTILELAEKILELTNSKSKVIFKDLPKNDPLQRKPDISNAKEILSWSPKVQLNEGLEKTISFYESTKV